MNEITMLLTFNHNYLEFWIHMIMAVNCLLGALLFSWWWWKSGKVSIVFKYITFAFWATASRAWIEGYGEYIKLFQGEVYLSMWKLTSYLWHWRILPVTIAGVIIVWHMAYRAFVVRRIQEDE